MAFTQRELSIGDEIVAKYPGFRGAEDNPWFAATVTGFADDQCAVQFEDGDTGSDLSPSEILYAPGRDPLW